MTRSLTACQTGQGRVVGSWGLECEVAVACVVHVSLSLTCHVQELQRALKAATAGGSPGKGKEMKVSVFEDAAKYCADIEEVDVGKMRKGACSAPLLVKVTGEALKKLLGTSDFKQVRQAFETEVKREYKKLEARRALICVSSQEGAILCWRLVMCGDCSCSSGCLGSSQQLGG